MISLLVLIFACYTIMWILAKVHSRICPCKKPFSICMSMLKSAFQLARQCINPQPNLKNSAKICIQICTIIWVNAKSCKRWQNYVFNMKFASEFAWVCRNPKSNLHKMQKSASLSSKLCRHRRFWTWPKTTKKHGEYDRKTLHRLTKNK